MQPPRAPRSPSLDIGTAGALSMAGHATAAFALLGVIHQARLGWFGPSVDPDDARSQMGRRGRESEEMEIETTTEPSPLRDREEKAHERVPTSEGGPRTARLDQRKAGRGGDDRTPEQALNLADQNDDITLSPATLSNLDANQLPRIHSANNDGQRRSYENYRATREPMELTFVAMGTDGVAEERRREARVDPRQGLLGATPRSVIGSVLGAAPRPDGEGVPRRLAGTDVIGGPRRSPGQGYFRRDDRGAESPALRNALARPDAAKGDPSVPALDQGRPSDTEDAQQAVADRMASLLHATTNGGRTTADGRGGEAGAGATGAGGTKGAGQSAGQVGSGGPGPGEVERMAYVRGIQSKVHPHWANAFPKKEIAEGRGGTATISFTIEANGSVTGVSVSRSSNIPEFDENVKRAVLKGAHFGPLPAGLKPRLKMTLSFAASNPAVRPKHTKNGPE